MNYYDTLAQMASSSVEVVPGESSLFSTPEKNLDPRLFSNDKLLTNIRTSIMGTALNFLSGIYKNPESWCHVWLAGSGVSYQWAAHRAPADLDCLLGIDYPRFRAQNPAYQGFSDAEIAAEMNEALAILDNQTSNFMGVYELTFYVNVRSDIKDIKPYSAYSLTDDEWVVEPSKDPFTIDPSWQSQLETENKFVQQIVSRYNDAVQAVKMSKNSAARVNAETLLHHSLTQASALFEDIHKGRKLAFSPGGQGYADYHNYRWQAGKQSGSVPALRKLKDIQKEAQNTFESSTYGVELPNASTLIRRALITRKGNE